jgi:hypothetical protein
MSRSPTTASLSACVSDELKEDLNVVISHNVSSYCYICVLILLYMCPHTTIYVSSYYFICVLILPYVCPHTAYVSSYCYIYVLILLYVCPHTAYVSSYCYKSREQEFLTCCHKSAIYVSSYCFMYYIYVLILNTTICASSYCYECRAGIPHLL